jgi:Na+/H+-dicarboxylate symporter
MMAERPRPGTDDQRFTLGTRILIGVLAGIALGVFLGAWSAPLQVIGDFYVRLLQMTVFPLLRW